MEISVYSQTLEIERRVLGREHPSTLTTLSGLAFTYQRQCKDVLISLAIHKDKD